MTTKRGELDKYKRGAEDDLAFAEEVTLAQVALAVADLLEGVGMTQRELAERIGVTEGRISQLLAADSNPTVRTLARIGHALGRRARLEFVGAAPLSSSVSPWPRQLKSVPWQLKKDEDSEANGPDDSPLPSK